MTLVVFERILTMLLVVLAGLVLTRRGYLTDKVTRGVGGLLVSFVIPVVVLRSFLQADAADGTAGLVFSFGLSALALVLSCSIAFAAWGRRQSICDFGTAFSNPSFFAIPLVSAVCGDGAVFYMAGYIALLNLLQWTYGAWLLTSDTRRVSLRAIFTSPILICTVAGVILYLLRVPQWGVVTGALDMIAQLNTPLAMLLLGSYLAQVPVRRLFSDWRAYAVCALRLLVAPLVTLVILGVAGTGLSGLSLAILFAAASPVGTNVALYAQQFDLDAGYASQLVSLSTLLSAVSMPLVYEIAVLVL